MKTPFKSIAVITALSAATSALALPTGAHWKNVDNCFNPVTGELTGLHEIYATYDLFVDLEPGDSITVIDSGGSGPNEGIRMAFGTFFQSDPPFGSDSYIQNLSFAAFDVTLPFDTAVALGNEAIVSTSPINWDPSGVVGTWFSANAGTPVAGPSVHIMRVTVRHGFGFLGGEIFVSGTGPNGDFGTNDPSTGVVDVPNAISIYPDDDDCVPTPGAPSIFAIAGLAALRRRRGVKFHRSERS
jgi:hypothetical protein